MSENISIANLRKEYTLAGLRRIDLETDPMVQFHKWFQQALAANLTEPNAMVLSTADKQGRPSSRVMLLKGLDERGFTFFTNYDSRKGRELAENPHAALTFFWPDLERQVRITGAVEKVSREESAAYFALRPKGSRLAAWVSSQSETITDQTVLEKKLEELTVQYPGEEVSLPPYWGGYVLAPATVEFWQGRPNRLHDRFQYRKQPDNRWVIERLSP